MDKVTIEDVHVLLNLVYKVQTQTEHYASLFLSNADDGIMVGISIYEGKSERGKGIHKSFYVQPEGGNSNIKFAFNHEFDVMFYRELTRYLTKLLEGEEK